MFANISLQYLHLIYGDQVLYLLTFLQHTSPKKAIDPCSKTEGHTVQVRSVHAVAGQNHDAVC